MKRYRSTLDIVLLVGLAGLAFLTISPHALLMPTPLQMIILAIVLVLLTAFLALLWRDHPHDEREAFNQALASRTAYVAGTCVLILTLIIQSFRHALDAAVPIALLSMIAAKILVQRFKDE